MLLDTVKERPDDDMSMASYKQSEAVYAAPQWGRVSDSCKELLDLMLVEDSRMRFTIDKVLEHPWFVHMM